MNAAQIISNDMTLEEKLAAIDSAMENLQQAADQEARSNGRVSAPIDPSLATICDGCE